MCGIAGIYEVSGELLSCEPIKRMLVSLKHRGPDDEGYLAANVRKGTDVVLTGGDSTIEGLRIERCAIKNDYDLYLGHRRLSILDLSVHGHQPMSNGDGTIWIVYNGEIYNYLELRTELKEDGCSFTTGTDTEVLLKAYERWGMDCVNKFNGMWAFVIYDKRRKMLFGSRDRFGVKPLYYFINSQHFVFASEIKALVQLPMVKRGINHNAVFDYLVFGWEDHEEETFFDGIFEVMPSHSFLFDLNNNSFKKWKYYELKYFDGWANYGEECSNGYIETTKSYVTNAIKFRLRSDVSIGSCLSGGIDSSSIVCTLNDILINESCPQLGKKQKVFTACYDNSAIDESKWAGQVVNHTGAEWHRVFPTSNDFRNDIEDLVYTQDVPFGSTSIYAQYRVMKLAAEHDVKVLLDGQGGDELFSGYEPSIRMFYAELLRRADLATVFNEFKYKYRTNMKCGKIALPLLKTCINSHLSSGIRSLCYKYIGHENKYINKDFWKTMRHRMKLPNRQLKLSLNWLLHNSMTQSSLKKLLRYEDRNSMRFSLESRTPFADDVDLIDCIFQIPPAYKIHDGMSKYLLRMAMGNILPEEIMQRTDKVGFATPEYHWIKENKNYFKKYIEDLDSDVIDTEALSRDWNEVVNTQSRSGVTNLWRFINYAIWKKVFFTSSRNEHL